MPRTQPWDPTVLIPGLAEGYVNWDGAMHPGVYVGKTFGRYGDTAILSTAGDLARFAAELVPPRFLSADLLGAMATRTRLIDGSQTFYGLGIFLSELRGKAVLEHRGSFIVGSSGYMLAVPARGLAVTLVTNGRRTQNELLSYRIAKLTDDSLRWLPSVAESRDPDPARTARVLRFFHTDSTALPMTPEFRLLHRRRFGRWWPRWHRGCGPSRSSPRGPAASGARRPTPGNGEGVLLPAADRGGVGFRRVSHIRPSGRRGIPDVLAQPPSQKRSSRLGHRSGRRQRRGRNAVISRRIAVEVRAFLKIRPSIRSLNQGDGQ